MLLVFYAELFTIDAAKYPTLGLELLLCCLLWWFSCLIVPLLLYILWLLLQLSFWIFPFGFPFLLLGVLDGRPSLISSIFKWSVANGHYLQRYVWNLLYMHETPPVSFDGDSVHFWETYYYWDCWVLSHYFQYLQYVQQIFSSCYLAMLVAHWRKTEEPFSFSLFYPYDIKKNWFKLC